ncbi:MAG: Fur family transcriptional regulator [Solirubrobacterales bacterium]
MTTSIDSGWAEFALETLQAAGHRRGGARTAVVEALAGHDCAVTALDLDDELRRREPPVGRASVYRALEQLEQLGLVQRIEVCRGTAGYERVDPTGHHHHHAICRDCGRMVPFEDRSLEQAIDELSDRMDFDITEHDVVLRGRCGRCEKADSGEAVARTQGG